MIIILINDDFANIFSYYAVDFEMNKFCNAWQNIALVISLTNILFFLFE